MRSLTESRFTRGCLAVLASLLLGLTVSGSAQALTQPEATKAEIVFSNAGRIVSMKADGSERTVLTREGAQLLANGPMAEIQSYGDDLPVISPDGKNLAFVRNLPRPPFQQVLVANRDGSDAKPVAGGVNGETLTLDWMPGGKLLLTLWTYRYRGGVELSTYRVVALDPASGNRRLLLQEKTSGWEQADDKVLAQELSPDGSLLLYTHDFGEDDNGDNQIQLRLLDLETGEDRLLVKRAEGGSFSPDGGQVAFTQMCVDNDGYAQCRRTGDARNGVWTIGTDGRERELIVSGNGEYTSPDWGPGGGFIIFASSRNFPEARGDASEIYSVRSDGVCLTWLTNGSPESTSPSWAPDSQVRADSGAKCGDASREALVESRPGRARKAGPRMWAGPRVADRLLSALYGFATEYGSEVYRYGDCPFFESSRCRRPIALEVASACSPLMEVRTPRAGKKRSLIIRGVRVTRHWTARGRFSGSSLRTGLLNVGIGSSYLDVEDIGGKPSTFSDHRDFIDSLRPVGQVLVPGSRLPEPALVKCRVERRR